MDETQRDTDKGKRIIQDYDVQVKVSGLDDLVQLNKLSSDISQAIEAINKSNYGTDAVKNAYVGFNSLIAQAQGVNAFQNLINGSNADIDYQYAAAF